MGSAAWFFRKRPSGAALLNELRGGRDHDRQRRQHHDADAAREPVTTAAGTRVICLPRRVIAKPILSNAARMESCGAPANQSTRRNRFPESRVLGGLVLPDPHPPPHAE